MIGPPRAAERHFASVPPEVTETVPDTGKADEMSASQAQPEACPECLGEEIDGLGCREMLGVVTSWEWDNPELGARHFDIVASYLIQHPHQYKDEAIQGLKLMLGKYLDGELSVDRIRKIHGDLFAGSSRVLADEGDRIVKPREWPVTIAHVYAGGPGEAVARVTHWAARVRGSL